MVKPKRRVSESQWEILLNFLKRNPVLARSRGYKNSAEGRAASYHLWGEVAALLNSKMEGATKTAKGWSIYISNYKSKLRKTVADLKADVAGRKEFSYNEKRFLALLGHKFEHSNPTVNFKSLPDMFTPQPTLTSDPHALFKDAQETPNLVIITDEDKTRNSLTLEVPVVRIAGENNPQLDTPVKAPTSVAPAQLPQQSCQKKGKNDVDEDLVNECIQLKSYFLQSKPDSYTSTRGSPLMLSVPLDETRRFASQVELHRGDTDNTSANAMKLIAQNLGRLADAAEIIASHLSK